MPGSSPFRPEEATAALQEAVRTRDSALLQQLVSDRFVFASGRSITRLGAEAFDDMPGKAEWIAAALAIEWRSFEVRRLRSVDLGDVVIVDARLTQLVHIDGNDLESSWVVTDVWVNEGAEWRLVARHPELVH